MKGATPTDSSHITDTVAREYTTDTTEKPIDTFIDETDETEDPYEDLIDEDDEDTLQGGWNDLLDF